MKNKLNYDFTRKIAIILLFSSMVIKFLTGAFLTGDIRAALLLVTTVGFCLVLVLLCLCVIINVMQTPSAERDNEGRIIIKEENDKE